MGNGASGKFCMSYSTWLRRRQYEVRFYLQTMMYPSQLVSKWGHIVVWSRCSYGCAVIIIKWTITVPCVTKQPPTVISSFADAKFHRVYTYPASLGANEPVIWTSSRSFSVFYLPVDCECSQIRRWFYSVTSLNKNLTRFCYFCAFHLNSYVTTAIQPIYSHITLS